MLGAAQNDVENIRMLVNDSGEGLDDVLDAFMAGQVPEGEKHLPPLKPGKLLAKNGVTWGTIRDAIGDNVDLPKWNVKALPQEIATRLRHGDQARGILKQRNHEPVLFEAGIGLDQM